MALQNLLKDLEEKRQAGWIISRNWDDAAFSAAQYLIKRELATIDEAVVYAVAKARVSDSDRLAKTALARKVKEEYEHQKQQEEELNASVVRMSRVRIEASLNFSGRESASDLERLKKQWEDKKQSLKEKIAQYFLSKGAQRVQLKKIFFGFVETASDGDVESRFSSSHHQSVIGFCRQYNEIQDAIGQIEDSIKQAEDFCKSYGMERDEW